MTHVAEHFDFWRPHDCFLRNPTQKQVLATKCMAATTSAQRARGLMFRHIQRDEALIFYMTAKQRISLHMLFVFFPIDVVFGVQESNSRIKVVGVKSGFLPFSFHTCRAPADIVIELPKGALKSTKIGDSITFELPKTI